MKKMIFGAMALGLVLVSCEKEEITNDTNSENTETIKTRRNGDGDFWKTWVYDTYEDPTLPPIGQCLGAGTDCAPEHLWGEEAFGLLDLVFTTVVDGKPEVIAEVFSDNYDLLLDYIAPKYLDGAIKGNFIVKNNGGLSEESASYLQFYDLEEELVIVYEFIQK